MDEYVIRHYETARGEADRLNEGTSRVEFERTKRVLLGHLPPPPAQILDVGGGPGAYSFWLAEKSYQVHLVDIVPLHIEEARLQDEGRLVSLSVGDARNLDITSESMDVVLLLGPLYHLPERADRLLALQEAHRVVKTGGLVFCAAISRFASLLDGLRRGYLRDPKFREITQSDLQDGKHLNPDEDPRYFTTAYFHTPQELCDEVDDAGFRHLRTVGLEGPAWLLGDFDEQWSDPERRGIMLDALAWVEEEPALLGASAHFLAVGKKC